MDRLMYKRTVGNVIHVEVRTEACTCPKLECGGVEMADLHCPEHGYTAGPLMPIHSHKRVVGT